MSLDESGSNSAKVAATSLLLRVTRGSSDAYSDTELCRWARGGHMQAIVATAHKIARIFYVMVKNKCAYDETKVGLDEQELLKKKIERTQRALNKLNARLSGAIG